MTDWWVKLAETFTMMVSLLEDAIIEGGGTVDIVEQGAGERI